jgi:hypothetical protein
MKKTIVVILLALITHYTQAQTKVFKEVSDGISSQIKAIRQDNTLVGYLIFTRLERANIDSFNYQITIMDENLNNIGKVNFKEIGLTLQGVTFDQDVLCLGYLKSNVLDQQYKNRGAFRKATSNAKNFVMTQFINLDGKIIRTNSINANINMNKSNTGYFGKVYANGRLTNPILVKNIPQKGFACFYGDEDGNNLIVFDTKGKQLWQKKLDVQANDFYMLTSGDNIYLLTKKNHNVGVVATSGGYALLDNEGDYDLVGYRYNDVKSETHLLLKDDNGNQLKVLKFDNDIATGKPYLAGCIINPKKADKYATGRHLSRAPYLGLFNININGTSPKDVKKVFTYWTDGSTAGVSENGLFEETGSYAMFTTAFRDFNGNTYFAGSEMIRKARWGSIASSIITSPLIIPPIAILGFGGTSKCKIADAMLVKQTDKGALTVENSIPTEHTRYYKAIAAVASYNNNSFYNVFNSDTKTNYLIVDDEKNISIYNVKTKKVVRAIPHNDGNVKTSVFPAKEGSIMVSEYNSREKYTRVSIEAL